MKNLFLILTITLFTISLGFSQSYEDLLKSDNPHNLLGEKYYNFLKSISFEKNDSQSKYDNLINFIKSDNFEFKININEEYVEKNKIYFEKISLNVNEMINLEKTILNDSKITDKTALLQTISIMKWSVFFLDNLTTNNTNARGCYTCWENCTDRCMRDELNSIWGPKGNWVKKTFFVLSAPASTAEMYASCSWDCARNTSSH